MTSKTDILIVGSGAAGLFCALNLPSDKTITLITKDDAENSDSFLAQGGICMLKSEEDYDSYFEDTMRAGHYENRKESVDIMIRSSQHIIRKLIDYGVDFEKDGFCFTKILPARKSQANCWQELWKDLILLCTSTAL